MSRYSLSGAGKSTALEAVPDVDPDALRQFASGAKDHRTSKEPPPWEAHPADAPPRYNASVRLNDHQLAMLRYISEQKDVSQQKVLARILLPAIKEQALELYGG